MEESLSAFMRSLESKNRSAATIKAYRTDILQFLIWCNLRLSSRHFYSLKISTKTCIFLSNGDLLVWVFASFLGLLHTQLRSNRFQSCLGDRC